MTKIVIELMEDGRVMCQVEGKRDKLVGTIATAIENDPNLSELIMEACLAIELNNIMKEQKNNLFKDINPN